MLEICKIAGTGINVGQSFTFTLSNGQTVTVQAGTAANPGCSFPLTLPVGNVTVTENAQAGVAVTNITVEPSSRLVSGPSLLNRNVTVQIVAGDANNQTLVTFTNEFTELKICKIAGAGIQAGEAFSYRLTAPGFNTQDISVPAVFAGQCSLVTGLFDFPAGTEVTIQELIPSGVSVTSIAVVPSDRLIGTANLATGTVTVRIGARFTEVSFTNTRQNTAPLAR